jgi:hypothetical protein
MIDFTGAVGEQKEKGIEPKTKLYYHPDTRSAIPADAACSYYLQSEPNPNGSLLREASCPCMRPADALLITKRSRIARYMCDKHAQQCLQVTGTFELVTTQKLPG